MAIEASALPLHQEALTWLYVCGGSGHQQQAFTFLTRTLMERVKGNGKEKDGRYIVHV